MDDALAALDNVLADIAQDNPDDDVRVCFEMETDDEGWLHLDAEMTVGEMKSIAATIRAHAAEIERLREALRPFAVWASVQIDQVLPAKIAECPRTPVLGERGEEGRLLGEVTVGDLRVACNALPALGDSND